MNQLKHLYQMHQGWSHPQKQLGYSMVLKERIINRRKCQDFSFKGGKTIVVREYITSGH